MLCALCPPVSTGCSATRATIEYRLWTPPAHLLADCPATPWTGEDWADVVELAEARLADVQACNADKAALRESVAAAREAWGQEDE